MAVAEGASELHPLAGIVGTVPASAARHLLHRAGLPYGTVPSVGRLQGQHVGYPLALQTLPESSVLAVEDVPHDRPKRDTPCDGGFDQFEGYPGLGSETGIFFAAFEVVRGGVGLDLQRVVDSLVGPERAHGDHPIVYLSDARKVLAANVVGLLALLAVASFVDDEGATVVRSGSGIFQQELDPAPVYLFGIPCRLREEPLQALRLLALRSHNRLGVSQGSERLVTFCWQQQPLQVTAESLALSAGTKEVIEARGIGFERSRSGAYGRTFGH